MLSDEQIEKLIKAAEHEALHYCGEDSVLSENRAMFMRRYKSEKFGDEKKGRSSVVISNTFNTIEGVMPDLIDMFDRGQNVVTFSEKSERYKQEAEEKTNFFTNVFQENNGKKVVYDMVKDGLLAYTGWVKTYQQKMSKIKVERGRGMTEEEIQLVLLENKKAKESTREKNEDGTFDVTFLIIMEESKTKIEVLPPEECLISKSARCFDTASFIGQRCPSTRSKMIQMGFDKEKVESLGEMSHGSSIVDDERSSHAGSSTTKYSTVDEDDKSQEELMLGEYYMLVDVDEDGISELWQFFYCDETLLQKRLVENHPYSVFVPIPITHRAIGTCPAENLSCLEYWHTNLVRQMNDNIYANNYNRAVINSAVKLDDYLSPRHGGAVRVEGAGDVRSAIMPLPVQQQVVAILQALSYVETERERITGVTSYNQGMDSESLNKTATGFTGVKNMSMKRMGLMARQIKQTLISIAKKAVLAAKDFGEDQIQMSINGQEVIVEPARWGDIESCFIDSGIGATDIQQTIANLSMVIQEQKYHLEMKTGLADTAVMFEAYDKLCLYTDLNNASPYFNDTSKPAELLQSQNEQLTQQLEEAKKTIEDFERVVMTEGEKTKGSIMKEQMRIASNEKSQMIKLQSEQEMQKNKLRHEATIKNAELLQKSEAADDKYELDVTKLELEHDKNIPGALI